MEPGKWYSIRMPTLNFDLPENYKVLVKEGATVEAGQILAKSEAHVEEFVTVPEHLDVPVKNVGKYIYVGPGDTIKAGDVIAEKKNFFGKVKAAIVSEINGTVLRFERDTGNLIVRNDDVADEGDIISPVEGTVELCNNKEIVIRTDHALTGTRVVSGTKSEGELFVLEESFSESGAGNVLFYLDSRAVGKIVLGDTFTRDILIKGVGIGTAGFLAKSISDDDIAYLRERNIAMPVMEIDAESIETLRKKHGQKVVIDAQTRTVLFLQ
jgi:hypothetical protein